MLILKFIIAIIVLILAVFLLGFIFVLLYREVPLAIKELKDIFNGN